MTTRTFTMAALALAAMIGAQSAAMAGWDPNEKSDQIARANEAAASFKKTDSSMNAFFDKAYGYAVYPKITKGGFVVGGASGKGVVFVGGKPVAGSRVSQGSFGAQIGAQSYSQILFFQDKGAYERFKAGDLKFNAEATAVAATEGAAASNSYEGGVAVFTMIQGGLMAEASLGGQKFSYDPF